MKPIVNIRNLTVRYDSLTAIDNADLDIYADDFIGIIGPNGGGKSSLVKAVLGMIPHEGQVIIDESLLKGGKPLIGYMPQITSFDKAFPISVREVVLSGLQNSKGFCRRYTRNDKLQVEALLDRTGMAHLADRPIGELSGGQMQRALLCRAIISEPKLLILDEPANFVDNKFENELYGLLQQLNDRMAIVMVSHDIGTISSVVKSIVCVNKCVHRHNSNIITPEQLHNYNCPIQIISHGEVPHTILGQHLHCTHCDKENQKA
ncbi:MAG: ATP-binding cassette domain-containing protein [Alistipes sp.]|nr:ATP-binding cassette domain-containing protein [Alistipes sp.]